MRGLGLGLGLSIGGPQWATLADLKTFAGTTQTNVTVTDGNQPDHNGVANQAASMLETVANSLHVFSTAPLSLVQGGLYRVTGIVASILGRDCNFGFSGLGFGLNVDLTTPAIVSPVGALQSQSVAIIGSLAYRKMQFSFFSPSTSVNTIDLYVANPAGNLSYAGAVNAGLIVEEITLEKLS